MTPTLVIRPPDPTDLAAVCSIHAQAFKGPNESHLVQLIHAVGAASISLLAQLDQVIVAHVLLSPVTFDPPAPHIRALGLGPIAVLPSHQRQGLGTKLINHAIAQAARDRYDAMFVLGDPGYYSRFHFHRAADDGFTSQYNAPDDFLCLELRPNSLDRVQGLVQYAPEFRLAGC